MSGTRNDAWRSWVKETARLQRELLHDAVAKYVYELALRVYAEKDRAAEAAKAQITELRQLADEQNSEILRLRAELDGYSGARVHLCLERDIPQMVAELLTDPAVRDGEIIRTTDTAKELVKMGDTWAPKT